MEDKYLWLEDVLGEKSLNWVKSQNAASVPALQKEESFSKISSKFEEILGNKDRIAFVDHIDQGMVYNFWTDETNLQGLWRRTTVEDFQKPNPSWEILLDLDKLSKDENQKWVFGGASLSHTKKLALIYLSPGGSDADYIREFSLETKKFVDDGFSLPFSKGGAVWLSDDEIIAYRDFGPGSMTASGYPKTARRLKRGQDPLKNPILFEVQDTDNSVGAEAKEHKGVVEVVFNRSIDFYRSEYFLYDGSSIKKLNLPEMTTFNSKHGDYFFMQIASDWREFKQGDCLAYFYKADTVELVFRPDERSSIYSARFNRDGAYLVIDRDVTSKLYKFTRKNGAWESLHIEMPENGSIDYLVTDEDKNQFFVGFSSFNTPMTYFYGSESKIVKSIRSNPSFFNHENIESHQHFVKSLDGTMIPYFLVHQKGLKMDGKNPTIIYGYGGFEISLKPAFSNIIGSGWLEHGGVFVITNIRGGGEYGPRWHQSALKEKRDRAYEDFFAIAEDLFKRNITSKEHLGAQGGSNGGLLMGVCYTRRPDLFKAINCGVPLLDMQRYHKLLAGFSWVAEYGNPDDEVDGKYIRNLSPYHRIEKDRKDYPVIFLNTSTKDDRVHPGHARKFAAKLEEFGHPYYYHENIDGGHAGASNLKELANMKALDYAFFWKHLK